MSPGCIGETVFLVAHAVHQADNGAATIQPADRAIAAEDQRRQMAGVGVGELRGAGIVVREEKRCVLLRLGAAVEVAIEQRKNASGRLE